VEASQIPAGDCLHISGIRAYGYTGFFAEEQTLGQWFEVDLTLQLDLSTTGADDELAHSLDYAEVVAAVRGLVETSRFRTIERLNSVILEALLAFAPVWRVRSRLTKLAAPIPGFDGRVAVEMVRCRDGIS
jgi:dihydroneopterin aldolase